MIWLVDEVGEAVGSSLMFSKTMFRRVTVWTSLTAKLTRLLIQESYFKNKKTSNRQIQVMIVFLIYFHPYDDIRLSDNCHLTTVINYVNTVITNL